MPARLTYMNIRDLKQVTSHIYQSLILLVLQAGHIKAVIAVIQDLEDNICEEDERLQDFVEG